MAPSRRRRSGGGASPPLSGVRKRGCAPVSQHAASRGARPAPAVPCVPLTHIPEYLGGFGRCGSISASLCYSNQGGKQRLEKWF